MVSELIRTGHQREASQIQQRRDEVRDRCDAPRASNETKARRPPATRVQERRHGSKTTRRPGDHKKKETKTKKTPFTPPVPSISTRPSLGRGERVSRFRTPHSPGNSVASPSLVWGRVGRLDSPPPEEAVLLLELALYPLTDLRPPRPRSAEDL